MCWCAAPGMPPSAAPHGRRLRQAAALASLGALPAAETAGASHAEAAAGAPSPAAASAPDPQPWPLTALPAGALWGFSTRASTQTMLAQPARLRSHCLMRSCESSTLLWGTTPIQPDQACCSSETGTSVCLCNCYAVGFVLHMACQKKMAWWRNHEGNDLPDCACAALSI